MKDKEEVGGSRSIELWLTAITGVIQIIMVPTVSSDTAMVVAICLTIGSTVYLVCRTCFKIAKMKYAPDSAVEFSAQKADKTIID